MKKNKKISTFKTNMTRISDQLIYYLGKVGQQRHLSVLRDSFATFLPFLILGAVGMVFITVIFGGWDSAQNSLIGLIAKASTGSFELTGNFAKVSQGAEKLFGVLPTATIDMISIYLCIFISWYLSKSRIKNEADVTSYVIASALSLGLFVGLVNMNTDWFGAKGILPAIFISVSITELFCYLQSKKKLVIKMPPSVPPAVGRAFSKLLALVIAALIIALINYVFILIGQLSHWDILEKAHGTASLVDINNTIGTGTPVISGNTNFTNDQIQAIATTMEIDDFSSASNINWAWSGATLTVNYQYVSIAGGDYGFAGFIYQIISSPLMSLISSNSGGLSLAIVYVLLVGLLWFIGLHGANMMDGIFLPIWLSALAFNVADQQAGQAPQFIFAQPFFEGFIWIGGGMGTLMLVTATMIFSKRKDEKEVAKFALVPGIFNINEPVVYGYPIVLNWRYFIPFVFVMPINVIVTWLFMGPMGIVDKPSISMPWTTPPILGSLIVTKFDWHAIFPTMINLAIAFGIYTPFIFLGNKENLLKQEVVKS